MGLSDITGYEIANIYNLTIGKTLKLKLIVVFINIAFVYKCICVVTIANDLQLHYEQTH